MKQASLFPEQQQGPSGLRYEPDFVSAAEEAELIQQIRELPLTPFQFGAFEGKRRVVSFGWRYDYGDHSLQKAGDLPEWLKPYVLRAEAFDKLEPGSIGQVSCSEYEEGVGIGWHRDKPHFERILGLSLASACKFRFRRRNGAKWERFSFDAEPRSLYRMMEEARHGWEHSIPPVERLRYSITFRTMSR
jgi:alkylated DNA repair dioxygenase AlkB